MRRRLLDEGAARSPARTLRHQDTDAPACPNDGKQIPEAGLLDRVIAAGYDLRPTGDRSMPFQPVLNDRPIAARLRDRVDRRDVRTQALAISKELDTVTLGRFRRLSPNGRIFPTTTGL